MPSYTRPAAPGSMSSCRDASASSSTRVRRGRRRCRRWSARSRPSTCGTDPSSWPGDAHQLEDLFATGDVALTDDADTRRVELHRDVGFLEPAPLVAANDVPERAGRDLDRGVVLHDPCLVL